MKIYLSFLLSIMLACKHKKEKELITLWCIDVDSNIKKESLSFKNLYKSNSIDGKTVIISGVFSYNFEDIALYQDFKSGQEGVWLNFNSGLLKNDSLLKEINGKKITVTGQIDMSDKGHLNSYFCSLDHITCIQQ